MLWFVVALTLGDTVDLGSTDVRTANDRLTAFTGSTDPASTPAALTLSDVARRLPAVMLRESGGSFNFTTLSIRGSTAAQAAVYLDGQALGTASIGTVDLSTLLLFDLGRIEVYRGFAPAELGPDGLFGAVVLTTRPLEGFRSSVTLGSFGTRELAAAWGGMIAGGHLTLSALYAGTRGDFPYFDDNRTPLNSTDDHTTQRRDNDQNTGSLRLQYTHTLGSALLRTQIYLTGKDQGAAPPVTDTDDSARYQLLRPQFTLALDHWSLTDKLVLELRGQALAHASRFTSSAQNFNREERQQESDLRANGVLRYQALPALRFTASLLGISAAFSDLTRASHAGATREQLGGSVAAELELGSVQLQLSSRLDGAVDSGVGHNDGGTALAGATRVWAQPMLSAVWVALPWLSVAAHGGYRERLPTFSERFGQAGSVRANLGLRSESVWSADLGIRAHSAWGHGELVYSEARAHDLVVFVLAPQSLSQAQNIGAASMRTVEMAGALTPWRYTELDATYTYQLSRNDTQGAEQGEPLPGRPQHFGRAAITFFTPWRLRLMYEITYTGDAYLDRVGSFLSPARVPQNIRLLWQPLHTPFFIAFDVLNLFDQTTARVPVLNTSIERPLIDVLGYPLPGRSFFVTLSYAFGEEQQKWERDICHRAC